MDSIGLWFSQNLPWLIISLVSIAMIGSIIWRVLAARETERSGPSLKTEIKIILAIALGLIIATLFVFFTQQFLTYCIIIGIGVLIFFLLSSSGGRRAGRGGIGSIVEISPIPSGVKSVITPGRKRLYIDKVFKTKGHAAKYVIYMKKRHGNDYAFQKSSSKTDSYGVVWGVYSDL
jgi:hypothetical protein